MEQISSVLDFLSTWGASGAISGAVAAAVYWLLQKFVEDRFAKRIEDYRHKHVMEAQSEDIRFSLYNRRFEIFSSIFDFYEAMISWRGTPEQMAAKTRFFRAYQESGFLFSRESGIEEILKQLNDAAMKVIGFKEHSENFRSDPQLYMKLFNETQEIQGRIFSTGLEKLKSAMSGYLNFHVIAK